MWILLGAFVAGLLAPGMVVAQDAREDGAPETSDDATSPPPADDAPSPPPADDAPSSPPADDAPSSPPADDAPPVDEAAAADAPPADDSPTGADGGHPASPESEGEGAAADALVPPSALEMAEAVLPEGQPLRSSAILRIVIGADGRVADASVIESAGEAFDAAAIDALRRSRFRPAMRAGEALAVALEYRFVFPLATRTEPPRESEVRALNDDATVQDAGAQGALTDGPDGETVPDEGDDESFGARARVSLDRAGIIERSVEAVNAIDTTAFADRAVDLGDVVAREQGVSLRRAGGLGSTSRICLVGFCDQQVRYFLDGVPLAAAGFPFGVANVPVGLVGTVEIYRGVVPLRLGADALGGAIDLRTGSALRTNSVAASYQVGSFGTHRATLAGRLHRGNFIAGATAFVDHTDNNYEIDVEVADERGRLSPARVRRFHDEYTAVGVALDAGLVDLPYARRLQLRLFGTGLRKEQQHNIVMTVPYGGVVGSDRVLGASLRHEVERGRLELDSVLNVSLRRTTFRDVSDQVFDWFGEVIRERRSPGEIQSVPIDQFFDEVSVFARLNAAINLADGHELQLSVVPTFGSRNGTDRLHDPEDGRNPLDARQRLFTTVVGAAYETEIV
ncbi:MAG: TonB family protein, partial [Myxococcota bacterium]